MPEPTATPQKSILFLALTNSQRTQMAEGWTRSLKGSFLEPSSAGAGPEAGVNLMAVRAMREAGVDISSQQAKTLDALRGRLFDYVVIFDAGLRETARTFSKNGHIIEHFLNGSGAGAAADPYRNCCHMRDCIRDFVSELPENLK